MEHSAHRRELARLERRAIAAYERDLLAGLRELAVVEAGCRAVAVRASKLYSIELQLTGRSVVLLGMSRGACADVEWLAATGLTRIVDAGRYDRRWWVKLDNGIQSVVVLAQRAYLHADEGGIRTAAQVA